MKPWNVTQIMPAGYVHAHALDDVAEYLGAMLAAVVEAEATARGRVGTGDHPQHARELTTSQHLDHQPGVPAGGVVRSGGETAHHQPRLLVVERAIDLGELRAFELAHRGALGRPFRLLADRFGDQNGGLLREISGRRGLGPNRFA
jgi:hypothetical protein